MSTIIKIKCIDQTLTYEGTPTVASGGINEDYVEFEFNTLWDGFSKVAVFYQNKGEIYYSLVSTDNTAVIPKEVIAKKGIMYLGVLGVKGNVTMTSQVLQYHIESGALDGFTPEEPTQEIYQQILAELQSIRDLSAETLSNEEAFEKAITEQQESYETDLNNQWGTYKTNLNGEWSTYKTNLTQQQTDYETKITKQQNDYEDSMNTSFENYKSEVSQKVIDEADNVVKQKMDDYALKTDVQTEINKKQNTLVSGTNIKTVNSNSLLGSGNVAVAPVSHATSATTYGVGTTDNYGHNKVINNVTSSSFVNGEALSAYQGKLLNDRISQLKTAVNEKQAKLTFNQKTVSASTGTIARNYGFVSITIATGIPTSNCIVISCEPFADDDTCAVFTKGYVDASGNLIINVTNISTGWDITATCGAVIRYITW